MAKVQYHVTEIVTYTKSVEVEDGLTDEQIEEQIEQDWLNTDDLNRYFSSVEERTYGRDGHASWE